MAIVGDVTITGHISAGSIYAATLEGALNVTGPSVLSDASATSLSVSGTSQLNALAVSGASTLQSATVQGNAAIAGALNVAGQSTLGDARMQTATVQKALAVNGPMGVSGTASFGSDLEVGGAGRFGSASVAGTTSTGALSVAGTSQLDTLVVSGASTMAKVDVLGPLAVTGAAGFGDLVAKDMRTEDLHVTGNLTIDGNLSLPSKFSFGELETTGSSRLADLQTTGQVAMNNAGSSFTLGSSGILATTAGGARVQLTDTAAVLTHGGNGITATANGTTRITAIHEATLQGGNTTLALTDTGARLSGNVDGVEDNDAVNVGQLNDGLREVSAGVAMSMAMAQLPAPLDGSNHSFGVAVGGFDGQEALALGGTAIVNNNVTLRGALSHAGGKTGAGVGVGWSF